MAIVLGVFVMSPSFLPPGEVDFVDELGPGASTVQKGRILAMGGCWEAWRWDEGSSKSDWQFCIE